MRFYMMLNMVNKLNQQKKTSYLLRQFLEGETSKCWRYIMEAQAEMFSSRKGMAIYIPFRNARILKKKKN